jgi:hypothetical protein
MAITGRCAVCGGPCDEYAADGECVHRECDDASGAGAPEVMPEPAWAPPLRVLGALPRLILTAEETGDLDGVRRQVRRLAETYLELHEALIPGSVTPEGREQYLSRL